MTRWLAVLALCLALPAAARASTIVYTNGGDVWIADMAGGTLNPVTKDGSADDPYRSPSQADDGTIVAVRGVGEKARLHRFDQAGNRLNAPFETAAPTTGPLEPQVSPDGSTVVHYFGTVVDGCGPFYTCPDTATAIQYTAADHFTPPGPYGDAGGFYYPSWIDNARTLVFSSGAWIHNVGEDNSRQLVGNYFENDEDTKFRNIKEGDISADLKRLAVVFAHYQDNTGFLQLFRTDGNLDVQPPQTCRIKSGGTLNGIFTDPTWSPDGTQLAWAEQDGIHVTTVDDATCTITQTATIDGAEPHWGPAPYDPPALAKPVLSKVKVAARRITFTVSEFAAVIFTFQRKVGNRYKAVKGSLQTAGSEGANTLKWNGKVKGRTLAKGTYRVTGVAVTLAGKKSKPVRVTYVKR